VTASSLQFYAVGRMYQLVFIRFQKSESVGIACG